MKRKKRRLKELFGLIKGNKTDKKFDIVKEHDAIVCGFNEGEKK